MGEEKAGSREGKCNIMKEKREKWGEKSCLHIPQLLLFLPTSHSLFFFLQESFVWRELRYRSYILLLWAELCVSIAQEDVSAQMWRECRITWAIRWAVRRHCSAELPQPLQHTPKVKRAPKEVAKVKTHHPPQLSSLLSSEEKPRSENQWQQRWKNFDFVELCPSKHLAESVRNYLRFHKTFCEKMLRL